MYYIAKLTKKKGLFQKPYLIKDKYIYITDTKRAKKAFLRSGIEKVVFSEAFKEDEIIGSRLCPIKAYNRDFVLTYLKGMLLCITDFLKLSFPLGEIAVYSDNPKEIIKAILPYGRIITIVGTDGDSFTEKGVTIRQVKRLKAPPDLYITEKAGFSSALKVPVIDLSGTAVKTPETLSYESISFQTDLFPFEINGDAVMYLKKEGVKFSFKPTSMRKKLPPLFTFS